MQEWGKELSSNVVKPMATPKDSTLASPPTFPRTYQS